MRKHFWLPRLVETVILITFVFILDNWLHSKSLSGLSSNLTWTQIILQVTVKTFFPSFITLFILYILKKSADLFNISAFKKHIEYLIIELFIFIGVNGTLVLSIFVYLITLRLINLIKSSFDIFKELLTNFHFYKLTGLGFHFIILFPFLLLIIIFLCIVSIVFYIIYSKILITSNRQNKIIEKIAYAFLKLSIILILSLFTVCIFSGFLLYLAISFHLMQQIMLYMKLGPKIHFGPSEVSSGLVAFIMLSTFLLLLIALGIILLQIFGLALNQVNKLNLKINLKKYITHSIWHYIVLLDKMIKYLVPFSIFGLFYDLIYVGFILALLFYLEKSEVLAQSSKDRKYIFKITQEFEKLKPFYILLKFKFVRKLYVVMQINIIQSLATKMLLFGDLKQSNILYSKMWDILIKNKKYFSKEGTNEIFNIIFYDLCNFYILTAQDNSLKILYNKIQGLMAEKKISVLTYLSSSMMVNFAKGAYSTEVKSNILNEFFPKAENLVDVLDFFTNQQEKLLALSLHESFKFMTIMINIIISSREVGEDFATKNSEQSILVLESLKNLFDIQDKVYTFAFTQAPQYQPTESEIFKVLQPLLTFDIVTTKFSFKNPFLRENLKLIPYIYLFSEHTSSLKAIEVLIDSASYQSRQVDLAFLKCCLGKVLIRNGSISNGITSLQEGINLYEGLRHSISSDQIAVGFGSSYLEYYGWAIDALFQVCNPQLAFDYAERATARALLDLVSRKTSSSHFLGQSNRVGKLIGEIQDFDFNSYFSQSSTYKASSFVKFLPAALKIKLESNFYKNKKQRLNRLSKHRDSLITVLETLDPVAATLIALKPFTWEISSAPAENSIPFESLWTSQAISETEVVLCFHVIHKLSFAKNKPWDKIACFALYRENGTQRLHHRIVDNPQTVAQLQNLCEGITAEVKKQKPLRSLEFISDNLTIPLLQHLPERCNSLIISANSGLQFFPWLILYDQDANQLIERFRIRTTPGLSLLYLLKQREDFRDTEIPTRFLVAGVQNDPSSQSYLFWSGVEVNRISQLYASAHVLKDADVDQHFAEQFKQAEVIHYSGHGQYEIDPEKDALEKTYLCLYNRNISAAQILNGALENPAAKVMILSACWTGWGDLTTSGSEILGLERALFHAGLSSLITTLWPVNEFTTALLMLKLHTVWCQNNNTLATLAGSLREAQIWLKTLSWRQLKQEYPEIEQDIFNCIDTLIARVEAEQNANKAERLENSCKYYQNVANLLQSESPQKPFLHPLFWAGFQVKGIG